MSLIDILFPISCLECGREGKYICNNCIKKVEVICRTNPANSTRSIFRYEGVIRRTLIALKYKFAFDVANELAKVCTQKLKNNPPLEGSKILVIPIPLHKKRENWRGFNQSEILGKLISKEMNWEFEPNLLVRKVATKPQVGLSKSERVRNISGKFAVNSEPRIHQNMSYLVFDDVLTTGSTLQEAIKVLRKKGAMNVIGLTIAK